MKIIDISVTTSPDMPFWTNSRGFKISKTLSMNDGAAANVSFIESDVHVGTHVDAPRHFIADGKTTETLALKDMIGQTSVIDFTGYTTITSRMLERIPEELILPRMLFKTDNSRLWEKNITEFQTDFVALTQDAAIWLVGKGVKLVGIDYLSIQLYDDSPMTHIILLGAEVIILEGLNLSAVQQDIYEMYCLPVKIQGADGAPARAILIDWD